MKNFASSVYLFAETHFQNRFWKGLEDNVGQTPISKIKEGRSGIAAEYENEPKDT